MKILHLKDAFEQKYPMRDEVQVISKSIEKGHDISIITSRCDLDLNSQPQSYFEMQEQLIPKLKTIRCKGFKLPFFSVCAYLPPISVFREYDLIHAHNIGSYSTIISYFIKKVTNKPLIIKADFDQTFCKRLEKNLLQKLIFKPVNSAEVVTTFTNYEKQLLIKMGVFPEKIHVVPIGIKCKEFFIQGQREDKKLTIGFMGRFTYQKGIHRVIDKLKELMIEFPHIRIVFAGQKTDPIYAEKILREMKEYEQFEYKGFVNSSIDFYTEVDIVLIPSMWETGSIATLESMAAGKAVVASNINPHNEYIEHGVSGYLAGSDDEFYIYCKNLIMNEETRLEMGKRAIIKAEEYDWEKIFAKIDKIYAQFT